MPRFAIRIRVTNNTGVPVKAHVGASLVGKDWAEFYNKSEDVTRVFNKGKSEFTRYITTDLGKYQKYDLVLALWEGEKPIGKGKKYASFKVVDAVEKRKKKRVVKMTLAALNYYPKAFAI